MKVEQHKPDKQYRQSHPISKTVIIGYVSQTLLWCLIITYACLSQSLFSAISITFLIVSIVLTIATPYHLCNNEQLVMRPQLLKVISYPVEKILWGVFIVVNLIILILKAVLYFGNDSGKWSNNLQEWLEIQSLLQVFLPMLLLPFASLAILIQPRPYKLLNFKKKLNKFIPLPLYLSLGILILLIQIFSVSIAGLIYFCLIIYLFAMKTFNFKDNYFRCLLIFVQVLTTIMIILSFMATSDYAQQFSNVYQFFGLNSINNFSNSPVDRGHFICQILLSLLCAYLNRLFNYQKFNTIYSDQIKRQIDVSQLFGKDLPQIIRQQPQASLPSTVRRLRKSMKEVHMHRVSQKVIPSRQQVELREFSERQSFHSDNHEMPQHDRDVQEIENEKKDQMFFEEVLNLQDQKVEEQENKKFKRIKQKQASQIFKQIRKGFIKLIHTTFSFLNSPQFSLRVIELISIIVIQRYNNIYSFVALLWLAMVASIQNLKLIMLVTAFCILPLQIINYIITYFYNIPYSPAQSISNGEIYGFQNSDNIWLDVIIFNVYLNYIILFIRSYSQLKAISHSQSKAVVKKIPSAWMLFVSFVFRYTYLLTLIAMFFLGFSKPNVMNMIFVILFLLFFSNGDNLIIVKKQKLGKIRLALTTFSKRYWFIIVYYTLICIIGKYIYFLFFSKDSNEWLAPFGIDQPYQWSFNFSLSSFCKSNTTPQFIIFVLAEIQIMIYRSYTYTNLSFSIMANVTDNVAIRPTTLGQKLKVKFISFIVLMNQLYYQSIYYISGIVIIACSYRWSLIGLTIIILTSIGLLTSYNKKLLGVILILNLLFLFGNYAVILILGFPIVFEAIGEPVIEQIKKISYLIGFSMDSSSYAGLFVLNVFIFYFCVLCYGVSNILESKANESIVRHQYQDDKSQLRQSLKPQKKQARRTSFISNSIIDSQFQDEQFAQNYKKGVILQTQKYYSQNLIKKYEWMRTLGRAVVIVITDIVAIFVIIQCLYFRLSISMFLFLLVYMVFYFSLFDRIGSLYVLRCYYRKVENLLDSFMGKQMLLEDRNNFISFVDDKELLKEEQLFIRSMEDQVQDLKNQWKRKIWKYSAILSATCLILTYASQFIISEFYQKYINFAGTERLQQILFVVGISVSNKQSFGSYVYFYYIMLIINIFQKLTIKFITAMKHNQSLVDETQPKKSMKQLTNLQNPQYLINQHIDQQFIGQTILYEQFHLPQSIIHLSIQPQQPQQYCQQANMLIYFQFKHVLMQINFAYGCLNFIIRFYLWLMLMNVYAKNNIFSIAYLVAVLVFWFRRLEFNLIRDINKAAIVILLLQYLVLLLDINPITSPLPLPTSQNMSFLEHFIDNQNWVNFIAISREQSNSTGFLVSFLINSIIIFLTQICFTVFQAISNQIIRLILQVYMKYQDMLQKLKTIPNSDPIIINYQNYKHFSHRIATFFYQNIIMNSYLLVSLLMFMLLSGVSNYLAIFLLTVAFLYIYLGIFTRLSESDAIFKYTRIYFRIFNVLQFIIILISIVLGMPFIPTDNKDIVLADQFGALTSLQQIFLILFIQLWLDLNASSSFSKVSQNYRLQMKKRQNIFLRCLTYQRNNYLIHSLIRQYKEVFSFDTSIGQAMRIIKVWHSTMNKQMETLDYQFQQLKTTKQIQMIKQQIQSQKIADDHRQFSQLLQTYIKQQTQVTLTHKYYDTLKYVIENINGIVYHGDIKLTAWNFILEDYDIIQKMIQSSDQIMAQIVNDIINGDQDQTMEQSLKNIKEQFRGEKQEQSTLKIELDTPDKLIIDPEASSKQSMFTSIILPFILSNIEPLIILLIQIYYMINPCLLSLPLLAFAFCYYLLACRKHMYLVVLYIFFTIIIGQILQFKATQEALVYIKFFYYVNTDDSVNYCLGYLYFLFVVIFVSQQIIRYNGNRYKNEADVQNLQQAFLRILMNQSETSKLNLWKYSNDQQQFLQNVNPFNIGIYQIQNNLTKLLQSNSSFSDIFSNRKIGVDLYPPIAAVQIFITIYLIFFYPLMTDVKGYDLSQSTKYYQFSSDMVISVLVHVANIVIQRNITVRVMARGKKLKIKYGYTVLIFLLFSWFVYFIAPYKQSIQFSGTLYSPSLALIFFSFFYFIYFYLSALQIKYGYKQFKSFNSLMTRRGFTNYYAVAAYTAIPFLYQIKIIMDWTFSQTSLTMYDWFRQFSIYLRAFKSKIQYYNSTQTIVLGHTMPWYYKIIGWTGFILILLIIFGPMILFSGLNPIAKQNLVISGSMSVSLQVMGGNSFTLYQTSHFSTPPYFYNEKQFDAQGFNNVPVLQQMSSSDIPQQFQNVTYEPFSDQNWGISAPNYQRIIFVLNETIYEMSQNITANYSFQIVVTYQLNRQITQTIASDTSFYYPSQTTPLNITLLTSLYNTLTNCNASTYLPNFYISLIRLNTIGNTYKPRPIIFYNGTNNDQQPYLSGVTLNLQCLPNVTTTNDTNNVYWSLASSVAQPIQGVILYVYCDKYQNIIGGYGFTALYTSIILVIAGFIRSMFDGNLPLIPYEMNPKPDNILQICQAINILRVRRQFRQEYLLYYQLIDIIRSPQIMKYMSGSYPYLIEKAHQQTLQKEEEQEQMKRRTL